MKKLYILITGVLLFFPLVDSEAQQPPENRYMHQVGLQFNPYLNGLFYDELSAGDLTRTLWVASARYGFNTPIHQNLWIGGEATYIQTSGRTPSGYAMINAGPWARYIFLSHTWVNLFAESSLFLSYADYNLSLTNPPIHETQFDWGLYFAPGISLYSANSAWSFDLAWKFSPNVLIDNRYNVFSFKICFHF